MRTESFNQGYASFVTEVRNLAMANKPPHELTAHEVKHKQTEVVPALSSNTKFMERLNYLRNNILYEADEF